MRLVTLLAAAFLCSGTTALDAGTDTPCHECPQTVWYVNASSPPGGAGTSWATAFRQLQPAINSAAPGDCIWVAAGVYTPTLTLNRSSSFRIDRAVQIYGGFDGSELCLSNRAGLYWATVLSGDIGQPGVVTDNSYTVVSIEGPVPKGEVLDVVLDGFRITGGYNDAGQGLGGGIYAFLGELTLQNCFLRRNEAQLGGGLCSQGCNVSIRNTGFGRNTADDGGGFYVSGGTSIRVFSSTFRRNVARKRGGGVYLEALFPTTQSVWANVLLESNQAKKGGAMFLQKGVAPPPPTPWTYSGRAHLVGCTVTRNSATVFGAGLAAIDHPILVSLAARLEVENSIVWNNGGPGTQIVGWIGTDVSASIVPPTSAFAGGTNLPLDPMLVPPEYRPMGGSPAIDAGELVWILKDLLDLDDDGDVLEPTPLDRQGRARVQGAGVDMGAAEF